MTTTQITEPIDLTDLKGSVQRYLRTHVTTTASVITPSDDEQEVLTPGQRGRFTISATNGDEATGVRLLDVRFHLEVKNDEVVGLLAPGSAVIRSSEDGQGDVQVPRNEPFAALFIQNMVETTLEAGQTST